MSDASRIDPYGFRRPPDFDYEGYEAFFSEYLGILARRASRWKQLLQQNPNLQRNATLKRYVRKGIPGEHREKVWMKVSGAEERMRAHPSLYSKLLRQTGHELLKETINKDVPRTYPENVYFHAGEHDPSCVRPQLYRVLLALGIKNPAVGYCQGLNFIAGLVLLTIREEEKVFWLMDVIVNDLMDGYYTTDMKSASVDQEVLGQLLWKKSPKVGKKFENEGVECCLISSKWFLCLYADVLPVETVLRIWDCFFYEGAKVLFRVAITLIQSVNHQLVESPGFPEIINVCRDIPKSKEVLYCHQFIERIFKEPGSFPMSEINKSRAQRRIQVKK